jgi:hypothetical protein
MLLIVASLGGEAKRLRDEMQRKLRCLFGRCVTFGGRKVEFSSDLGVAMSDSEGSWGWWLTSNQHTAVAALCVGVLHDEAVLVFCTHTPMHCVLMITGHFSVPFVTDLI